MRPTTPTGNNGGAKPHRTRGAIRTHLGRKRTGARGRMLRPATLEGIGEIAGCERQRQEDLFDRLSGQFQHLFTQAGETTLEALDRALDTACEGFITAGSSPRTMRGGCASSCAATSCIATIPRSRSAPAMSRAPAPSIARDVAGCW